MKKWLIPVFALALLMIPLASAEAQPAPPLTNLQFIGITSDGNNYVWEELAFNQTIASIPLTGTTGYIAVYAEGTIRTPPNFPILRQSGTIIPTSEALPNDYVTGPGGIVIGTIYYRSFDLNDVNTGNLSISAQNYNPPYQTYTDFLYITVE